MFCGKEGVPFEVSIYKRTDSTVETKIEVFIMKTSKFSYMYLFDCKLSAFQTRSNRSVLCFKKCCLKFGCGRRTVEAIDSRL